MVAWHSREAANEREWRIAAEDAAQDVGIEAVQVSRAPVVSGRERAVYWHKYPRREPASRPSLPAHRPPPRDPQAGRSLASHHRDEPEPVQGGHAATRRFARPE